MTKILEGPTFSTHKKPKKLIIMLHGYGDNAENFILNTLLNNIENYETEMNFKGSLIEYCMKKNISITVFRTIYVDDRKTYKTKISRMKLIF